MFERKEPSGQANGRNAGSSGYQRTRDRSVTLTGPVMKNDRERERLLWEHRFYSARRVLLDSNAITPEDALHDRPPAPMEPAYEETEDA